MRLRSICGAGRKRYSSALPSPAKPSEIRAMEKNAKVLNEGVMKARILATRLARRDITRSRPALPTGCDFRKQDMMQATFVFDLDGTLVDTAPDLVGALNVVLALENLPPVTTDELRHMVGHGARALIERGLASRGRAVSETRFEDLVRSFMGHY